MGAEPLVIPTLAEVKEHVGRDLGASEWVEISQEQIDAFADVTGDRQWIHVDPERARNESPWKTTIAHGYLTLALVPRMLGQLVVILGFRQAVNSSLDKLRFSAPVPAGSRVRLRATLHDARDVPRGGMRVTFAVRCEVEGSAKPALLARVSFVYLP